jgi:hypothetical protein
MRETIVQCFRRHPFQPFTVQLSNGVRFEVRHTEMAALTRSTLIIANPDADDVAYCSLLHIANVTTNGQTLAGS